MAAKRYKSKGSSDYGGRRANNYVSCGYGATSWLQVELVAARVRLQLEEDGAGECTTIAEDGSDGLEQETTTGRVHFDASHDQGSW
ncbi:hypothetical protein BHE74_00018154 [Ensete ventricosum]|nr:hypothetical protein GW17_00047753 [Ensete ventricosum]RWW73917.1 hypothetical protein BHE74_00018154 [Ensete ventricosum]RZS05455.1 hypothetical protein BHM03_00035979 [Ensete ventricosum]